MSKRSSAGLIPVTEGSLVKNIILFAIPVSLTGLLQLIFSSVDNVVIGRYCGADALASMGTVIPLVILIVDMLMGLSTGAAVCSAQAIGSKQRRDVHEVVHTALLSALIGGAVLGVVGIIFAEPILRLIAVEDKLMEGASVYLRIYLIGLPFMLFFNFGSAILRSAGDTKRPLCFLFIGGGVNLVLNLIFVIAFNWGIPGVAVATAMSQLLSASLVALHLMRCDADYKFDPRALKIYKKKFIRIIAIGIPAGVQSMVFSLSNVIIQASVNSLGASVVAGTTAAGNLEGYANTAMSGFYQSAITFAAQNMGAKKIKRMNRSVTLSAVFAAIVGIMINGICMIFANEMLGIFIVDDVAAIEAGYIRIFVLAPFHFLCGIMQVYMSATQAMGATVPPVIISIIGSCGIRITWILTVFRIMHSTEVLFWCYPISWVLTLTAMLVQYFILKPRLLRANGLIQTDN